MKSTLVSTALSLAISLCLLLGTETAASFAYYVLVFFTCLSVLGIFTGVVKGELAARIRRYSFLSGLSTAFQLYALIATGHPLLAAASFIVSFFIVAIAFGTKEVKPA
jgi:hypothetical protein